jgi:hypothetical protein
MSTDQVDQGEDMALEPGEASVDQMSSASASLGAVGGVQGAWSEDDRVIGAAVGITMTRYGMAYADASLFLRGLAGSHERPLLDLAHAITTSRWPVADSFDRAHDGSPVGRLEHTAAESSAGRLLDLLVETPDLGDLLEAVARLAAEWIPGCDFASITLIRDGAPATVASSDVRALRVDELQYSGGQGPCLQAARTDEVVEIHDLAAFSAEPGGWAREAIDVGIRAVLALPIASDANIAAALNLFCTGSDRWPPGAQSMAEDLAIYTGAALTLAYRHVGPSEPVRHA